MKKLIGHDLLDAFVKVIPYLNQLILLDVGAGVYNTKQVLAYQAGETLDTEEKIGEPINQGGAVARAIRERKMQSIEVPREVYGVPFKAISLPVFDYSDNVIGAVAIATSLDNQQRLEGAVDNFFQALQKVNGNITEITEGAEEVAQISGDLDLSMTKTVEQLKHTDEMLLLIKAIAKKTRLLGLNAAIEAVKAGEEGRGFTVVAQEIGKLSESSANSVTQVGETIKNIGDAISEIGKNVTESTSVSDKQKLATQEIAAYLQELTSTLEELKKLAKII